MSNDLLRVFPPDTALVFSFALTGMVFPLGFLFTRIFGGDLFAKSATFTPLGYAFLAISTCLVLSGAAVVTRGPLFHQVPWIAAGCYAIAVIILWGEVRRLSPARS